jgi:hypothetical protein
MASAAIEEAGRRVDGGVVRGVLEPWLSGWVARCVALVAAYVALAYVVAARVDLPIHWPLLHLYAQARLIFLLVYGPLALGCVLAMIGQHRELWQRFRGFTMSPAFFFELLIAMAVVQATIMVFVNLKQFLPALNDRLYDSQLWRIDAALHLGVDPAAAMSDFAAQQGLLPWLDQAYLLFFPAQVVVPLLFLIAKPLRPLRGRFFFAFCLMWMLGGLSYVLVPSLGPAYYRTSRFVWLDQAPYARYLQNLLMADYVRFRQDPAFYTVKLYQGVAAFPSLHVAVLALFAIAAGAWRKVAIALWLLTAVTFAGSLALGWHYAVDGYAGVLLAALVWAIARLAVGVETADDEMHRPQDASGEGRAAASAV